MKNQKKFAILITTRDRLQELVFTLRKIEAIMAREDVECIICDDGSADNTYDHIRKNFPDIAIRRNEVSKGLIFSRNRLLELVTAEYAISIDDDLHFITENPLEIIEGYFVSHPRCSLISFRIFWSKSGPVSTASAETAERVKCFAGGAHALRTADWKKIPDYPEWFVFYGEENFAGYEMFLQNMEIHYVPAVLVHHRVDTTRRKKGNDYQLRLRRSLRSGWYLYFMFMPVKMIPRKMLGSIWVQLRYKVFRGDVFVLKTLVHAFFDLVAATPKIIRNSNRFTYHEYVAYMQLAETKLYWKPENESEA